MFSIENGRAAFWQWDVNQRIVVADSLCSEVHFCNRTGDCSLVCRVYEHNGQRVADVPNILLQTAATIRVYAYVADSSEKHTRQEAWFTVLGRTKPADYVYTETELYTVEEMLEEALQAAKESGDFKGEKGDKGDKGDPAELSVASPETLGAVKPAAKTEGMTQPVGVDEIGGLWTKPSEGGGSGGDGSLPKVFSTTLTEPTVSITLTELDGNPLNLSQWQIFMYVPNTFADYKTKVYMYPLGELISKVNYVWEAVVSDTTAANTILVQTVKDNFLKCLQSKYCGANNSHFMTYRPEGVTTNNIFITTYNGKQPLPVGTVVEVYGR